MQHLWKPSDLSRQSPTYPEGYRLSLPRGTTRRVRAEVKVQECAPDATAVIQLEATSGTGGSMALLCEPEGFQELRREHRHTSAQTGRPSPGSETGRHHSNI